ncbi:MAG TPA: ferritin-like domain-containing protein [Defluviitoga sp.]|nr:ferritin-like domain-containing protein [Defluviitoga sp.]HOP24223.1 ferritin-like domain-containing protein [Defluviitoga sp.]HPZ28185.1 ferritin-like domain-containing protein [Defluviitoga sp.]HQD62075.1 ferritin-like domain-containing protein [Defluviitoga sp.]
MQDYHQPYEELSQKDRSYVYALNSLKEEIEAIDWYNQRAAVSKDKSIKEIMEHNRDEEIEHAVMIIEWLRRNMPGWDEELRKYLFTQEPLLEIEEGDSENRSGDLKKGDLGLRGLKE